MWRKLSTDKFQLLKGLLEGNPDASNHPWNSFTTPILKKKSAQPTKLSPSDLKSNAPKRFGPRVWPHPDAIPVQSRPFPTVSGRRHVPHLVNGNGFPFLRFKKPQSPYLGRLIRDSLRTKTKRNNRTDEIRALIEFGIDEDVWDEIVEFTCGLSRTMENTSWAQESQNELSSAMELINDTRKRRADMGEKLQKIVEHEQELADAEKAERRREKKRARMLRKSAQKASISQISEGSLTSSPI